MKRVVSLMLLVTMLVVPFGMTALAHWADADVDYLIGKSILSSADKNAANLDALMIRGEFVTLVNKVYNFTEKAAENFKDVPADSTYYDAFAIAKAAGYITGNAEGEAKPNDSIVRGEVAVILARVQKLTAGTDAYPESDVQAWAAGAVSALNKSGIMKGYEDGTFKGYNNISNAEGYVLGARLHKLINNDQPTTAPTTAPTATAKPTSTATAAEPDRPVPTLKNEKGNYMVYDTFNGVTKFEDSGWKALSVDQGSYSTKERVFKDMNTPGIGTYIFGVRSTGGGTGGGIFKEFPRMIQVLSSIPAELDKPDPLPADTMLIIEYDIKWGCDTDAKRMMAQIRAPYGGDGTPLTSYMYQGNHADGALVIGTSDKQNNAKVSEDAVATKKWYRFRQELYVTNGSGGFGQVYDFYLDGVKKADQKKYMSTSGAKVGVIGVACFSTSAWSTDAKNDNAGISVDNFSMYLGSTSDKPANKGELIAKTRQVSSDLKTGKFDAAKVPAIQEQVAASTLLIDDYKTTQAQSDAALAALNAAIA